MQEVILIEGFSWNTLKLQKQPPEVPYIKKVFLNILRNLQKNNLP